MVDIKEFSYRRELVPRQNYGNFEKGLWKTDIDPKINGKIVSLDELVKLFPSDDNFSELFVSGGNDNYFSYARQYKLSKLTECVAYQCKQCNSLIVGMPVLGEEDSLGPLVGRRGSSLECKHCHAELKFTGIVS